MNQTPTIYNDGSNHTFNPPYACDCCGRRFRVTRARKKDKSELDYLYCKAREKRFRLQQEQKQAVKQRELVQQRMIDRADYLHLIPPDKRFSHLSLADELKYQFFGKLEKRRQEERRQLDIKASDPT